MKPPDEKRPWVFRCSDAVAIEVLARQLASLGSGPGALLSLCPWLEFITIPTQASWDWLGVSSRQAWQLTWHDYRADHGSSRYGREWDASWSVPLAKGLSGMLKYADYRADSYARDTRKLWLQIEYKGSHRIE